ncbi:MAG TPA: AAA family ATPase [Myxococcota bacterium]|nr:AAA family ATPase [Myxococcota bacterium]
MQVSELHIKGFKSMVDQTIALGRLNCFIGANGVGKSNILEALGVLGAAASGRVDDEAIIRRGVRAGLPRLFKTSFASGQIPPHIFFEARGAASSSAEPAAYRVSLLNPLGKPEPAWSYKSESLSDGGVQLMSRAPAGKKNLNLDETAGLAALQVVVLPPDNPASRLVKALQAYAIYTPNTPALRATSPDPQTRPPVGLVGGGLAEGFEALKRQLDPERLDEILELIDWVSDVGASDAASALLSPSVPRAKHVLRFTDRFMATSRNTLTAYDASEGALYVLFAAVLCLSPHSPSIFAIDNLDSALNPRLVTRLVSRLSGWLRAASPERQLLFTAHNPSVLDGLDLQDDAVRLFAMERNTEGHSTVRRIVVSDRLRELNTNYPLSRLWTMGHLGAVPLV